MADAHYIEEARAPLMEAEPSKKTGWATTLTLCTVCAPFQLSVPFVLPTSC